MRWPNSEVQTRPKHHLVQSELCWHCTLYTPRDDLSTAWCYKIKITLCVSGRQHILQLVSTYASRNSHLLSFSERWQQNLMVLFKMNCFRWCGGAQWKTVKNKTNKNSTVPTLFTLSVKLCELSLYWSRRRPHHNQPTINHRSMKLRFYWKKQPHFQRFLIQSIFLPDAHYFNTCGRTS